MFFQVYEFLTKKFFFPVLFNVCRFAAEVENLKAQSCCIRIIKPLVAQLGLLRLLMLAKENFFVGLHHIILEFPTFVKQCNFLSRWPILEIY